MVSEHQMGIGLEDFVLEQMASPIRIVDVQEREVPISRRVRLRLLAHRAQVLGEEVITADVWFDVWDTKESTHRVIFSCGTLERLGFFVAHRNEHGLPFDPRVPNGNSSEIWKLLTSPATFLEHHVKTLEESRVILNSTILPAMHSWFGKETMAFERAKGFLDQYQETVLRSNLMRGDRFKGVKRYMSKPAAVLVKPRLQPPYPPSSINHRIMLQELALLTSIGILKGPVKNLGFAYPMFLVDAQTKPRVVVNTAAAATNILPVSKLKKRTLGEEIKKQQGLSYRIKFDLKGAFHLNVLDDDMAEEIRQVRYGDMVFTSTRTIMGEVNSAEFLNRAMDEIFGDFHWLSRWMDDLLLGAKSFEELADKLGLLLHRCAEHGVVLSIKKMEVGPVIYWCGTWFDGDSIKSDSHSKAILTALEEPTNGAQLAKIIGAVEWFSKYVPRATELMLPLRKIMESIYAAAGSRKNSKVEHFLVRSFGWSVKTTEAWNALKAALAEHKQLALRDPTKALVLHCDASLDGFSGLLMQCPFGDLGKSPVERDNQLLECCGGSFTESQRRWATVELEGYAIIRSLYRFWHIVGDGSTLHIFTDNQSLSYIFEHNSSYVLQRDKPGQGRLMRWIALLLTIPYTISHVPGEQNTFADIISRLKSFPVDPVPIPDVELADMNSELYPAILQRVAAVRTKHNLWTIHDRDWVGPSMIPIRAFIGKDGMRDEDFAQAARDEGGTFDYTDRVWKKGNLVMIPPIEELKIALIISAHSGVGGHRGVETTLRTLEAVVYWRTMAKDAEGFLKECIHCLEKTSHYQDRPWGTQIMPHRRNQVVSFDYLHLGPGEGGMEKLLVVTDKLTSFTILYPCTVEDSESAARGLMDFMSNNGRVEVWLSDQSPAFKNSLMEELAKRLGPKHRFVTANSSWANGKQERLNLTIGNLFRSLLSENQMLPEEWPKLVQMVQLILNSTATATLGWKSPMECFKGLQPVKPLDFFLDSNVEFKQVKMSESAMQSYVEGFQKQLSEREALLAELQEQQHVKIQQKQLAKRGVKAIDVAVGDYVMVLNDDKHKAKLAKRWIGPAQVIAIDPTSPDHVVTVKYVGRGKSAKREIVHVRRLKAFDMGDLTKTSELLQHAELSAAKKWEFSGLTDLRKVRKGFEVLVSWNGDFNPTWEPLSVFARDAPKAVAQFLNEGLPETAKPLLGEVSRLAYIRRLLQKEGGVTVSTVS